MNWIQLDPNLGGKHVLTIAHYVNLWADRRSVDRRYLDSWRMELPSGSSALLSSEYQTLTSAILAPRRL